MNAMLRRALRAALVVAAAGIVVAGLLAMRAEEWPIYLAFVLAALVVSRPGVEVLPGMPVPLAELATTFGFLYIVGLPIVVLRNVPALLAISLDRVLPVRWVERVPALRTTAAVAWGEFFGGLRGSTGSTRPADWALLTLGLGVRWGIAVAFSPDGQPTRHPGAIALGELGGYACWAALSLLPIFAYRPPLLPPPNRAARAILTDMGLVFNFALTPFVFLITYGYAAHGLLGAVIWSIASLGLHGIFSRLNERRITVEAQNYRLETLNRELEHRERLSAIGKMSSVVSHQILHQLGVIGLYADLIHHTDPDEDAGSTIVRARENAGAIEDALADVNRVLTDLLVFSRDLRLNLYVHALDHLLAEAVDAVRPEAAARGITFEMACPADIEVTLDKLKMTQVVANVLRNAVEVSQPGDVILVRAAADATWATIAVIDHGPGVPAADRAAVFTPFFTTKEHGTGLGLAIAHEFTVAHGGSLSVEPTPGGGATFVVRLPRAGPASAAAAG